MTTLRALIIEDSPPDALLIQAAIGRAGFETSHVLDGAGALKAAEDQEYHLILIDLCLPDISGNDLILALRGMETGGRAKIIAHTSDDRKESIEGALSHGADDVFLKSPHRIGLLEHRFKGLAHKMRREEQLYQRMGKVETDVADIRDCIHQIAAKVARVPEIVDAWEDSRTLLRAGHMTKTFFVRTKWLWAALIAMFIYVKTGTFRWPPGE